jgi:hypothetical protein
VGKKSGKSVRDGGRNFLGILRLIERGVKGDCERLKRVVQQNIACKKEKYLITLLMKDEISCSMK